MLNDSGTEIEEEFLDTFLEDSFLIVEDLNKFLSSFSGSNDVFEKYGQQIDRMMGAAYTISLISLGDMARAGKELGYKGSQVEDISQLLTIQSLLGQLTRAVEHVLKSLRKGVNPDMNEYSVLLKRLNKASNDLGELRASVKATDV
jgi:hypothetical protein